MTISILRIQTSISHKSFHELEALLLFSEKEYHVAFSNRFILPTWQKAMSFYHSDTRKCCAHACKLVELVNKHSILWRRLELEERCRCRLAKVGTNFLHPDELARKIAKQGNYSGTSFLFILKIVSNFRWNLNGGMAKRPKSHSNFKSYWILFYNNFYNKNVILYYIITILFPTVSYFFKKIIVPRRPCVWNVLFFWKIKNYGKTVWN